MKAIENMSWPEVALASILFGLICACLAVTIHNCGRQSDPPQMCAPDAGR